MLRLDVIIPTYNRASLLQRLLDSILDARRPAGLSVHVTVVDNNSTDTTRTTVEEFSARAPGLVTYVFEARPGKSHASNRGIAETGGDILGFVDDDEELRDDWFEVLRREFADPGIDFIGGVYLGNWEHPAPAWLPPGYGGVIGIVSMGDAPLAFSLDKVGIPNGGNVAIRRSLLDRVGPFATELGRRPGGLGSCEDLDMYLRLMAAGGRGRYVPDLAVRHFIPAERLTKRYHRRWCYDNARSVAVMDRISPQPAAHLGRLPRYMLGDAARALVTLLRRPRTGLWSESARFAAELRWWKIAGFLREAYGFRRL